MSKLGIEFTSKIKPIKPINEEMTLCKCYVMAVGKNRNHSIITKEAADDALSSLYNIPVVGHLIVDNEDKESRMGGHDMTLESDGEGGYKFKKLTVPYGVVPQQENVHYEKVDEEGETKTYLVADVILWTGRYPELINAKYSDNIYYAQSMEINPIKTTKEDGYTNIEKYQYSALCLLGKSDDDSKNIEPCFRSAEVIPYEFSETEEWVKLFAEFKEALSKCYSPMPVGTKEDMDQNDVENLSETTNENSSNNDGLLTDQLEDNDENQDDAYSFRETVEELRRKLQKALDSLCVYNELRGIYYWYVDNDEQYVYSSVEKWEAPSLRESYHIRLPYEIRDLEAVLDLSNIEKVRLVWLSKEEEDKLAKDRDLLEELTEYKRTKLEDERRKEYSIVLGKFSDLGNIDEYKTVVKNVMEFENVDALTEKLYSIRGKYIDKTAKKPLVDIRIPVGYEAKKDKKSEIDEFMNRYLAKK